MSLPTVVLQRLSAILHCITATSSTDPSSPGVRNAAKEKGIMVAKYFNSAAAHFDHLQEDLNNMVFAKVSEVNTWRIRYKT